MVQDYDGTAVVDAAGEKIGTVERSYVDDSGAVRVVRLKIGMLRAKHRLVPVDEVQPEEDTLRVPYTKQMVEDSPDVDVDDDLEGETLARVRAYYGRTQGRVPDDTQTQDERQVQPDDRRVVPEREALVRDAGQAETRDAAAVPAANVQEMRGVRDLGDVIEVPIVEEELVKRPVVKEILRIRKHTVTDQQQVDEELRTEDIEIDREGDADVRVEDQRRS